MLSKMRLDYFERIFREVEERGAKYLRIIHPYLPGILSVYDITAKGIDFCYEDSKDRDYNDHYSVPMWVFTKENWKEIAENEKLRKEQGEKDKKLKQEMVDKESRRRQYQKLKEEFKDEE